MVLQKCRASLGVPLQYPPWTSRKTVLLRGLRAGPREKDVLDVCFVAATQKHPSLSPAELRAKLWVNVSQSVERLPWSLEPPCFSQNSLAYSYHRDVVLSGMRGSCSRTQSAGRFQVMHSVFPWVLLPPMLVHCFPLQLGGETDGFCAGLRAFFLEQIGCKSDGASSS